MDIASPNTEEVTTARWFVMRAYKSEKRAEEKLKGKDGLEYFIPKCYAVRVYHGVKSKRLVPVIPISYSYMPAARRSLISRNAQFPAIRDVGEKYGFGISCCSR